MISSPSIGVVYARRSWVNIITVTLAHTTSISLSPFKCLPFSSVMIDPVGTVWAT